MAERTVVNTAGNVATFKILVKDKGTEKETTFQHCASYLKLREYVAALSDKAPAEGEASPLEVFYNLGLTQADLKARAKVREAAAAESTIVKRDGREIDIMKIPVKNAVAAINAHYAETSMLGGKPGGAFAASRRKLVEAGTVVEKDGVLAVK